MATAATGWLCSHTATITAQTDTTATIKVTAYWKNNGWTYDINHVSAWVYCGSQSYQVKNNGSIDSTSSTSAQVSCGSYSFTVSKTHAAQALSCYAKITSSGTYVSGTKSSTAANVSVTAKTSYSVTYAANGGSSAPATQTKWHGENLTLSNAITRTGYSFNSWLSSAQNKTYAAGALYGYNEATTMTAQWTADTYAVTYNANGGTGAPAAQTKTYGTTLKLSSTVPTRENYNFKGWATSAGGSAAYAAGANYADNKAVTLYAVWEIAYIKPRITGLSVLRCNANGAANDGGTYAKVSFSWATDQSVTAISVAWAASGDSGSTTISASGTGGTISQVVGGSILADKTYTVTVTVTDSQSSSADATLGGMAFTMDKLAGGKGVAFGKPAEKENTLEVAWDIEDKFGTQIANGLAAYTGSGDAAIDPDTTLEQLVLTNKNTPTAAFYFVSTMFYNTKSETANKAQIAVPYNANARSMYHRYMTGGAWSSWQRYNNFIADAAGTEDPDTTVEPLILTSTNTPMGDGYYMYIQTVFQGTPSATGARSQTAIPYNRIGSVYHRYYASGAWSEWRRHVNADENLESIKSYSLGTNGAGYIHYSSGLCIQWGNVAIALSAKTVGSATVTFQTAFSATPSIVVTAQSTVPGTYYMETAMASPSNTSFKIYAYRTNADSGTYHRWVAIGYKA